MSKVYKFLKFIIKNYAVYEISIKNFLQRILYMDMAINGHDKKSSTVIREEQL